MKKNGADAVLFLDFYGGACVSGVFNYSLSDPRDHWTDDCAMLSFLAVVVLTKVYTGVYLERRDKGRKLRELEQAQTEEEER